MRKIGKIIEALALVLAFATLAVMLFARAKQAEPGEDGGEGRSPAAAAAMAGEPEEGSEALVEPGTFVISAIGDCTLASSENFVNSVYGYAAKMDGDYAYPFSNTVQYFEKDDYTIANLECVLSDSKLTADIYASQFHFQSPTEWARILIEGGVDFVTTANNHLLKDFGSKGAEDTYAALEEYGIPYGKENQRQIVTTDSGLVLGIYCDYNGLHPDKAQAVAAVNGLKVEGAEYIICMFHWGEELHYSLDDRNVELARACIDAGANLIYGSHSHCLQPIEEYNGGVILYSMGNWSFGGSTMPTDPDTAIVQITVSRAADGSVSNDEITVIPCGVSSQKYVKNDHYNDYRPTPYEEGSEEYQRVLNKLDGNFKPESEGADYSNWWAQQLK